MENVTTAETTTTPGLRTIDLRGRELSWSELRAAVPRQSPASLASAEQSVTEIIDASDYYRGSHGTIHRACLALWGKGEPVDAITLANELEERGELEQIGGAARVAELAALVSATANVEHYARIVKEKSALRALILASQRISARAYEAEDDPNIILDEAEQAIFAIAENRARVGFLWQRRVEHESARLTAGRVERMNVFVVEPVHQLAQPLAQPQEAEVAFLQQRKHPLGLRGVDRADSRCKRLW